jgi:hypothetical protein
MLTSVSRVIYDCIFAIYSLESDEPGDALSRHHKDEHRQQAPKGGKGLYAKLPRRQRRLAALPGRRRC